MTTRFTSEAPRFPYLDATSYLETGTAPHTLIQHFADLTLWQSPRQIADWDKDKAYFYRRYGKRPNGNADTTHYTRAGIKPHQALYRHTQDLSCPVVTLIGAGTLNAQSPEVRYLQLQRRFYEPIALDPYATPDTWFSTRYYPQSINDPIQLELIGQVDVATLFSSIVMDIAPSRIVPAMLHVAELLGNGGIAAIETNIGYTKEVSEHHRCHPQEPIGIFTRTWPSSNPARPIRGKFMRLDPIFTHTLAGLAGLTSLHDYYIPALSLDEQQNIVYHQRVTMVFQKVREPHPDLLALVK